ncbi:multidrug resistance-associated protein 5 [Tanacetum coccineum]
MIPGTDLHQFDVHNDGHFAHLPLTYVDGVILEIAVLRMPYEQLTEFLEEKCGCYFQETFGRLTLYLDHLDMNVSEYLSYAITYDMDACVYKKIVPPKKRYCNDFFVDEMVDWAEMEVETEGVEARTSSTDGVEARSSTTEGVEARNSTKDKGKEKVSKDASDVVKTRRYTIKVDSKTEYESDDDSDYQSNKSVDYLSPGEDELVELRNRMKANRKAKAKAKDKQDSKMTEPNEENSMPADNVRGETFEEHDIYINELLKSLKTADKDGITKDPFISVEKHVERSGEVRVVAKYGQRPPRVPDPKKVDEHTCVRNFNFGALVNYKWIAKIFGDKIRANPDIRLCDIADLVTKKYKCKVSPNQCTNAKKYALTEYEKSIGEHYSMLRSYGKDILDSNLGSTIKLGVTVNPDGKTYFDKFYVYFAGLTDGWKAGYRKIIALDGCFLKNPNQGKILTTIGRDGNNHIYPVAWAVVDRGCEAIENGFSECFNSVIFNVRHKPLLTMLEAIRVIVFERMNKMREISRKWNPGFWHVIPAGRNLFDVRSGSEGFTVDEGKRKCSCRMWQLSGLPCVHATKSMYSTVLPPKPRKMPGKKEKNQSYKGLVRDESASGTRGGAIGSRGRGGREGVVGSRGGASGSISRGAGGSSGASGSRGRGAGGSRGKKKVGTSGFAKWFGLQDELEQTQDEPEQTQAKAQQTQHEPEQTQVEDQVEQAEDQAEIDLTQVEQTQEQTQEQVQPQEQPQQAALRMPIAKIL